METVCFSETLASTYESRRRQNPEHHHHHHHPHRRENLKSLFCRSKMSIICTWRLQSGSHSYTSHAHPFPKTKMSLISFAGMAFSMDVRNCIRRFPCVYQSTIPCRLTCAKILCIHSTEIWTCLPVFNRIPYQKSCAHFLFDASELRLKFLP
jgi:hypothetical protein